jgi:D-alanyl-D-alanine carboxypeptidase
MCADGGRGSKPYETMNLRHAMREKSVAMKCGKFPRFGRRLFAPAICSLTLLILAAPARADRVDDIVLREMSVQHIPGLALAVMRDGKVLRFGGYGESNTESRMPVTAKTAFAIASISKQFLAAGIMILVQDGKIALDDTVPRFLPDAPVGWRAIAIRELLSHTSGLVSDTPGENRFETQLPLDAIHAAYAVPLSSRPGQKWQYSNLGYYVLAEIISRSSGQVWSDFMAHRVFGPLGMSSTRTTDSTVPDRAIGYEWDGKHLNRAREWGLRPSGAYLSNVEDMAKWDAALIGVFPLSSASKRTMWTAVSQPTGNSFGYGFGWVVDTRAGKRVIWHSGGRSGFKAFFARFPDDHLSFLIFTNAGHSDPEPILWQVASTWFPGVDAEK